MALTTPVHGCHRVRVASRILLYGHIEDLRAAGDTRLTEYWDRQEDIGYYGRSREEVWEISLPYTGKIRLSQSSHVLNITENFMMQRKVQQLGLPAMPKPQSTCFHLFPKLPTELQVHIWDLAIGSWTPRLITAYLPQNRRYPLMAILTRKLDRHLWNWLWTCSYTRRLVIRAYGDPAKSNFLFNPELDTLRIVARESRVPQQYLKQLKIAAFRNLEYYEEPWSVFSLWWKPFALPNGTKDIALSREYRESDGTATVLYRLKEAEMDDEADKDILKRWEAFAQKPNGETGMVTELPRILLLGGVPDRVQKVEARDEPSLHYVLEQELLTDPECCCNGGIKELTAHYTIFHGPWGQDINELRNIVGEGIEELREEGLLQSLKSFKAVVETKDELEFPEWAARDPLCPRQWEEWASLGESWGPETDNLPGSLPHYHYPAVMERDREDL